MDNLAIRIIITQCVQLHGGDICYQQNGNIFSDFNLNGGTLTLCF